MGSEPKGPSAPGAQPPAQALLQAFEDRSLDPAKLTHRCHLLLAWTYLQRHGFPEGAVRFCEQLKEYVASVGAQSKYHETITWAYLVLLNEERVLRAGPGESFEAMIQRRPDFLDHPDGAIARCYTRAQLDDPAARRVFMLPT